ncbi:hypothetical protein [Gordonia sp. OPL2]|uniref:alcohol dehydrogenase catalytic domain-containing protein n=1 Tax=Gordonia sp. OPL2 TaxID=2486274 RepID=UPI0021CC5C21|nr:hypothetical protein [Gordonia sp. OPL2]
MNWSSTKYKDGLASRRDGKVARLDPIIPGIDLAGTVIEPGSSKFAAGTPVVVHRYDLGVAHHGGYSEYARVPAEWVVPLPEQLTQQQAMALRTAGFTAALSVIALEDHGLRPESGPVLVTGSTGGVGSTAVFILANRGYEITAVTGKPDAAEWLRSLGATEVIGRTRRARRVPAPSAREVFRRNRLRGRRDACCGPGVHAISIGRRCLG